MELLLAAILAMVGSLMGMLRIWIREHHRRQRVVQAVKQLPHGSRYYERADGLVIEFGPRETRSGNNADGLT